MKHFALRMAIALAVCIPSAATAQTVTLPTIRTGKSLEAAMLNHFVDLVRTEMESLGIAKVYGKDHADSINCDLTKLALAAFDSAELRTLLDTGARGSGNNALAASTTIAGQRTAQLSLNIQQAYQEHSRGVARNASARALSEAVKYAPASCKIFPRLKDEDIRDIIERYLEAETNVDRKARLDTLGRAALANVIQTTLRSRHWLPARTHDEAMAFWKQSSNSSLNVGAVSGSGDKGATFTEITSRFLHPIRISINAVLAATKDTAKSASIASGSGAQTSKGALGSAVAKDSTSASTVTRFLNGGGLFNVAAALPWLHYGTSSGAADVVALVAARVGGTLPVLGATASDTTMLYDVGTELFFKSTDRIDGIGFFMQSRIAVAGGSKRFMTLIGDAEKRQTAYQTVSVGLTIDDKYLITVSRTIAGPHSLQTGWQIGTTLARSAAAPSTDH
ncbi:MAG: hypothetical protein ABIY52_03225 [Gemmatimonadaceae bacterium]